MATSANVSAGKPAVAGAIYVAPLGTSLPTDATTALAAAYKSLGYISDAGVTFGQNPESETIKAWGGDPVLTLVTGRTFTAQFTMLEAKNIDVLKLVYGEANVSGDLSSGITVKGNAKALEGHVIVIDTLLTNNTAQRYVFPEAYVTDVADVVLVDNDAIGYQVTITGTPGSDGDSQKIFTKAATGSL